MTTTEILATLARFTDAGGSLRYPGITRPWAADGYLIATDARVMAFVKIEDAGVSSADHKPSGRVPNVAPLIVNVSPWGAARPIPDVDPQWEACPDCDGQGAITVDADAKDGWRGCKPDPKNPHVYECEECDGSGRLRIIKSIEVGPTESGRPFLASDHYLALLRSVGVTYLRMPCRPNGSPAVGQVGPITVFLMGVQS